MSLLFIEKKCDHGLKLCQAATATAEVTVGFQSQEHVIFDLICSSIE